MTEADTYEQAVNLQGFWGYTPANPIVDPQAEDTTTTQSTIHCVAPKTIPSNSKG